MKIEQERKNLLKQELETAASGNDDKAAFAKTAVEMFAAGEIYGGILNYGLMKTIEGRAKEQKKAEILFELIVFGLIHPDDLLPDQKKWQDEIRHCFNHVADDGTKKRIDGFIAAIKMIGEELQNMCLKNADLRRKIEALMTVNGMQANRLYRSDRWITIPDCVKVIKDIDAADGAYQGLNKKLPAKNYDSLRRKIQDDLKKNGFSPYPETGTGTMGLYFRLEDVAKVVCDGRYTSMHYPERSLMLEFEQSAKSGDEIKQSIKRTR